MPHYETLPSACPNCDRDNERCFGWSLVFGDFLDCGNCGVRVSVPRDQFEAYARRLHEHHAKLSWQKPKREGGRVRGAG